ncbi:uncharacterized protein K460DRAFT_60471 [Cucurbitaria berberidis CBS 394.84]|uniref:Secreted protein n=1 Tax=Cucurbitaria berberidis CBS 394.84 TaxID=1168544 RepID=A0A9P4GM47_9PLEO|nr:uncharacterized protein K460DRAFT_60471 [Cucurbitaria berberidis CBS 394.84]KAF1847570.1 hypothetical protein K460DRAFT_60471 [Cucurbitaria berberidis CBS 394.84]
MACSFMCAYTFFFFLNCVARGCPASTTNTRPGNERGAGAGWREMDGDDEFSDLLANQKLHAAGVEARFPGWAGATELLLGCGLARPRGRASDWARPDRLSAGRGADPGSLRSQEGSIFFSSEGGCGCEAHSKPQKPYRPDQCIQVPRMCFATGRGQPAHSSPRRDVVVSHATVSSARPTAGTNDNDIML